MTDLSPALRLRSIGVWVLVGIGAVAAIAATVGIGRVGIGWDAPIDAQAALDIRALPAGIPLAEAYERIYSTSEFYGVLISQAADFLHRLVSPGSDPMSPGALETYRWQAGVTVSFAIASAGALGWAVRSALRSALAGAFAWALVLVTPLFFGMSYVDFKDMPVAAGLTLLSSGLILSRTASTSVRRWVWGLALSILGCTIAMTVRPASWTLIGGLGGVSMLLFAIADLRRRRALRLVPPIVSGVAGVLAAVVALLLTNPFARIDLVHWIADSYLVMRSFFWPGTVRTAGMDLAAPDLPWWYVPAWLLAQLPLLTTLLLLVSTVAGIGSVARARWALPRGRLIDLAPFLVQGLVLPFVIVAMNGVIYDGLRHVLFMVPGLAAVAAIGVATLDGQQGKRSGRSVALAVIVAVVVVASSAFATARWYPYSYAFINPVAGMNHDRQDWELDYWGLTAVEGARRLQEEGFATVAVVPTPTTSSMIGAITQDEARAAADGPYGLYAFRRLNANLGDCEQLFTIERDGQVLGEGGRCER